MTSAKEYANRVQEIIGGEGSVFKAGSRAILQAETVPEAKQLLVSIRQMQQKLRHVKKEINVEMKTIRAGYAQESARVQPSLVSVFQKKGKQRSSVADQKRKLREKRDRELAPYDNLKLSIDDGLIQLDGAKLQVQAWIDEQKAAA